MTTASLPLPIGFRAAGVHAGVKPDASNKDMCALVSDQPAVVAGMFTTNKVQAAPVKLGIERIRDGAARAIIVNSGNANACTGAKGMIDAIDTAAKAAAVLKLPEAEVLVCSTGSIGKQLPMPAILSGIETLGAGLSAEGGADAADAILTTDTCRKVAVRTLEIEGKTVTLTGIAKGAGMIEPNMATMLSFVLTDAAVGIDALKDALRAAVNRSFNRISVDGDTSTNDTVLMLANGAADHEELAPGHPQWQEFQNALSDLVYELAMQIVKDGEGMTRFITLKVVGAKSDEEADKAARAIANSFLVKTGWAGTYPVWGRIMDVIGYCGVDLDPDQVSMDYDDLPVARDGMAAEVDADALAAVTQSEAFTITVGLGTGGNGEALIYTCDCTEEYVRINMF